MDKPKSAEIETTAEYGLTLDQYTVSLPHLYTILSLRKSCVKRIPIMSKL